MSDKSPPIVPHRIRRPRWDEVVPGTVPGQGYWRYSGSGMIGVGGKVWKQWIPIIYVDTDEEADPPVRFDGEVTKVDLSDEPSA